MNFRVITFEKGIQNFVRLELPVEHMTWIAKDYSRLWKVDELIGIRHLFLYKQNYLKKRLRKKSLKTRWSGFKPIMGMGGQ